MLWSILAGFAVVAALGAFELMEDRRLARRRAAKSEGERLR